MSPLLFPSSAPRQFFLDVVTGGRGETQCDAAQTTLATSPRLKGSANGWPSAAGRSMKTCPYWVLEESRIASILG
jgi:hypothetical protein